MSSYIEISKLLAVSRPKTPTLRAELSPEQAAAALKSIKTKLDRFKIVADEIAGPTPKASVTALIAESELELLTEFLSPDFQDKYSAQITTYETRESLEKFLKSVFRSECTDLQKLAALRDTMQKLTRFAEQGETFVCYVERLKTVGDQITALSSEKTAEIFSRDNFFDRNLTPAHKKFLVEQNMSEKPISEIASFLDSRQMNLPQKSVNLLESDTIAELRAQNLQLAQNNKEITAKLDRLSAMFDTHLAHASQAQVQNVAATNRRQPTRQRRQPYPQRPRPQPNRQERCQTCGLRGHTKELCRRPQHFNCNRCGRPGHLSYVCPSKN